MAFIKRLLYLPKLLWNLPAPKLIALRCFIEKELRRRELIKNGPSQFISQPKDILFIKLCGLGNLLLCTPALRSLRNAYPNARITLLLDSKVSKEAIEGTDLYNKIICIDKKVISEPGTIRTWRKQRYDFVILSYPMLERSVALFAGLLNAKLKIGHSFIGFPSWLFDFTPPINLKRHEVEMNLDIIRYLGILELGHELEIAISAMDESLAEKYLINAGITTKDILVAMVPGCGGLQLGKRWPADRYVELGNCFNETNNKIKIVLLGDSSELSLAEDIACRMKITPVISTGQTSIKLSAAIIKKCKVLISGDTGLMHVACAVKTPVVSIFGPTIPEKNRPWGEKSKTVVVRHDIECSPCYKFSICCTQEPLYKCISMISAEEVYQAAAAYLPVATETSKAMQN